MIYNIVILYVVGKVLKRFLLIIFSEILTETSQRENPETHLKHGMSMTSLIPCTTTCFCLCECV